MVLVIPFGVAAGYTSVTLAFQLKAAGASVGQVAALVALGLLPQTWKFLWAPMVDITLSQKKWYLLSCLLTAAGIAAMGAFPPTRAGLKALSAVVFVASVASTFLGMACESLIAYSTPDELRGRVSGWYQAGNLGGVGIGGGLGLFLAQRLPAPWMAATAVAVLCLGCCLGLAGVPTPERSFVEDSVPRRLLETLKDVWQVMRYRAGALALVLCFLPIGSGAAPFPAVATEWHVSADTVALVTGVLAGLISAGGCLLGGWMCDRMDRKDAYIWFGLFQAAAGIAMALLPRDQRMFVLWVLAYNFATGLSYAAFSAFVLEAIGAGAAATKYNALASLSNVPIYYMTTIDGWAHDKWNSRGMFFAESSLAVAGALVFVVLAWASRPKAR